MSEQSARSGSDSSVPSGYTGLTGLRAHSGSHISSVPSGYTGLTAMRSASAHNYEQGASERHQGVFARAYRSPAVSSNHSVPSTPQAQTAPVSAPGSHVSGGNAAAPYSPWQASDGQPAPVYSPHTHACRHVYGLEAYLDGLDQTAGGQEPHPADAIEIDEQEQYVYSPPSGLRTPGSSAPLPPVRGFFNVQARDWPPTLPVPTAADEASIRTDDDVRSQSRVRVRSGWAEYMRAFDLRYDEPYDEPADQRADTGVRPTEQIVANFDREHARGMGPIRQLMQEIREDMNRYDRRREEWIRQGLIEGPSKRSRQDPEGSSSKRPRRDSEGGPSKRSRQDSEGSSSKRSRRDSEGGSSKRSRRRLN